MESIVSKKEGMVGCLRFNRPKVYNSFNREMALALQEGLRNFSDDTEVRCIVLTGAGKAFSAGQDLNEAVDPEGPDISKILSEHFNPIIELLRSIEKPIIAAVNGVAAGAGANIALACDFCVASSNATFIQAFCKIGLIPDSGGTYILPRLIGLPRAVQMMMLGEPLTATEAQEIGLIYKSVPPSKLDQEVKSLAERLAAMPTRALGLTKRALAHSTANDLETQLGIEEQLQTIASETEDYKEGVSAFLEKRKPTFKGA